MIFALLARRKTAGRSLIEIAAQQASRSDEKWRASRRHGGIREARAPARRCVSSGVAYGEELARAAHRPTLRERAQATEDARMLLRRKSCCMKRLFGFTSEDCGGMERVSSRSSTSAEIGRAVPRAGNAAICYHHCSGYWEPETQDEVWDTNPDALIASSIALAAGRGRKVDGGFAVTGRWPFSSGVDNSDWNMLAVTVYDGDKAVDWRLCLVPKTDYEIIDTWYAMGMAGTGSKDVAVTDLSAGAGGSRGPHARRRRAPGAPRSKGAFRHPARGRIPLSPPRRRGGGAIRVVRQSRGSEWALHRRKVSDFQAVKINLPAARAIDSGRALSRMPRSPCTSIRHARDPDIPPSCAGERIGFRLNRRASGGPLCPATAPGALTRASRCRAPRDVIAMNQHF